MIAFVLLAVWPVMYAARYFGAHRTTFGWCLIAVFVTGLIQPGIEQILPSPWVNIPLGIAANGFLYSIILVSDIKAGIKTAVVSVLIVLLFTLLVSIVLT